MNVALFDFYHIPMEYLSTRILGSSIYPTITLLPVPVIPVDHTNLVSPESYCSLTNVKQTSHLTLSSTVETDTSLVPTRLGTRQAHRTRQHF